MKITPQCVAAIAAAATLLAASSAIAQTTSFNTGSLGSPGNGTNTANVTLGLSGAISAGNDLAVGYAGGAHTSVDFNPALNPAAGSPFTIEFWAKPGIVVDDALGPAPVFNRVSSGSRSGWVFFQRSGATGWNFRMYDGNGSNTGFDLTGGTYSVNAWSHVVAVWDGSTPLLYVDGLLADNTSTGSGIYNASSQAKFTIGSYDDSANPFTGSIDETAFYQTALNPAQILAHFNAAASPIAGTYSSLIHSDGAVEYLQNNPIPEPSSVALIGLGLAGCGFNRFRRK